MEDVATVPIVIGGRVRTHGPDRARARATRSMAAAYEQWTEFLSRCLATRLDPAVFEDYVDLLYSKHHLSARLVADIFLRPQPENRNCPDPRISPYLQIILNHQITDAASILAALYKYSTSHAQSRAAGSRQRVSGSEEQEGVGLGDQDANCSNAGAAGMPDASGGAGAGGSSNTNSKTVVRWTSSYASEEHMFYRLTKSVAQGTAIRSPRDAIDMARIIARWMLLFTAAADAFNAQMLAQLKSSSTKRDEMESARAGFVLLLLSVCENKLMLATLGQSTPEAKASRRALSSSLVNFVPSIVQGSSEIATRLELFRTQTLRGFEPVDKEKEAANAELDDILDSTIGPDSIVIPDMLITNTRAGLYIYLNSLLVGRPLIDDAAIFNYLHNRYQGDLQQTAIDLILVSFDIVANAASSREPPRASHVLRSYLTNKVPLLLEALAASSGQGLAFPMNAAACVEHATRQVGSATFPNMSESLVSSSRGANTLTEGTREDFLFACSVHGLIREDQIEPILNETTYGTKPDRLNKAELVQDCMNNPDNIQLLVRDLDKSNGNVDVISQALVEVLGRWCSMNDTMSLKGLCTHLAMDPVYLDVLLLFDKLSTILHPLCDLLDNWRYDEDQGESQPVYDQFGSILLLLLAFVCRYNLGAADLGVRPPDSFISRLFSRGWLSKPLDELSEQEMGHLDRWIHGLFDNNAGGLGDELMSSCPPQEFYLLIPTLFHNIILAISTGNLSEESLRSGVEYLVDTFLLPSLVPAIISLSNQLWTDREQEQKAIIKVLQLILDPSSISNEASAMLSTVLNAVAKPLDQSLRLYQRQDPANHEIEPLLRILREHVPMSRRTGGSEHNELDAWTSTAGGGISQAVRNTIGGLVAWSLNPTGPDVVPTPYTHRQFLAALKIRRARPLLRVLVEELGRHSEAGHGSAALDVCCALVCAPDAGMATASAAAADQSAAVGGGPGAELDAASGGGGGGFQRAVSLRQALRAEAEDWKRIQKRDPASVEHVVRLYRKVEAQMAVSDAAAAAAAVADVVLQGGGLGLNDETAAAFAAAAAVDAAADGMTLDPVSGFELVGASELNPGGSSATPAGGFDMQDSDFFGGLTSLDGWSQDMPQDLDLTG